MSVTTYFTKMRSLLDVLNALAPIPKCVCTQNSCTCGVDAKLDAYEQVNSPSQFLMGVNNVFTSIHGQMLMMKPLPNLSQAYSLLLQEESRRASPVNASIDSMSMNVKLAGQPKQFSQSINRKTSNATETCDYCHNTEHNQEKCFFLYGYSEWHRLYSKPKPKLGPMKAAQVTTKSADAAEMSGADTTSNLYSDAQCEQIVKMIQQSMKFIGNS